MLERIIQLSIHHRWLVLVCTLGVVILGLVSYDRLPIDAVPDITNIQVQINTQVPGATPIEVEQRVTFQIENALGGLPALSYTRSISRYGLSQVTAIFHDGTDIYFARQLISERLQGVQQLLPSESTPTLGPVTTGLGEIFMYTVENATPDGAYSPVELRTAQDWIVRPQLRTVPGVVDVNTIGGFEKEYHVTPRSDRLLALGLTLQDLVQVLEQNNSNVGAGYIERGGVQYLVRVPGQISSPDALEHLVVATREGKPVFLRDVASVGLGQELRTGAATEDGREVVLGTVFMLMGENSRTVSHRVAQRIQEILPTLPPGMTVRTVYDRTTLVDKTISTVKRNLFEGALFVIAVLFLFLRNVRAAIVTASVIPLALLVTVIGMVELGVSANLMSLGALDFGLIVDGSVIIVENCVRRLSEERQRLGRRLTRAERYAVVFDASREVRRATMFGELIIVIVYVPILALSGIEGKMFHPMAITVILALGAALVASVTFVPAAVAFVLSGDYVERPSRFMHRLVAIYQWALQRVLKRPFLTGVAAACVFLVSGVVGTRLGVEFIPSLDEGDIALHALRIPGTSLSQSVEMQRALEKKIQSFPEVSHTFTKIGTAEIANDPMPPSVADGFVILKPRSQWPNPRRPKDDLVAAIEQVVKEVPGNNYEFTQPIEMRFNELIAGVRSDVAIKIFGDDMEVLSSKGKEIAEVLRQVPGASDVSVEQVTGLPMIGIELERERLSRLGVRVADVQDTIRTAIGGTMAGEILEGDKRFKIVVRLPEDLRSNIDALGSIPISLPASEGPQNTPNTSGLLHRDEKLRSFVPLSSVANIRLVTGPNQISRENGKRRVVVTTNVRGRDLGSFVQEGEELIGKTVSLPPGYWTVWGGQFEHLISAKQRLMVVIPVAMALILSLLYYSFGALRPAVIVFSAVPLALSGGVVALWLRGIPVSVSAAVGFIALSGVAVLNGLVMISFIRGLESKGMDLRDAIIAGSSARLRPVLMTALVASLGLVPMAIATGPGAEVQRPLATVMIGGILTSTALTLLVLPAIYKGCAKKYLAGGELS